MSRPRLAPTVPRAPVCARGRLRLDLLVNPYGPSVHVLEALAGCDELHLPAGDRERRLHLRLAQHAGVPPDWLTLANGIDELLGMLLLWRRACGPVALFPPSDPADEGRAARHGVNIIPVPRGPKWEPLVEPTGPSLFPATTTAFVTSPNDPTGTILGVHELVRLTRRCALVVVDERHGRYSGRSVVPFVREFDNLIVLQTFETWAGLTGLPFAYAVAPPRLAADLAAFGRPTGVAMGAVLAATATLDDLAYVDATVRRVREEKSRLYRTLRKLNMISSPYPSWANFLLARVERGDAHHVAHELARRHIHVHLPPHPELANHLRISATTAEATQTLKQALIEIGTTI